MAVTIGSQSLQSPLASSQSVSDLFSHINPVSNAITSSDSGSKRHSACDECRARKLKCSGQPSGCDRCVKQKLICHYSEQKQMGRPRKRQKTEDEHIQQRTPPMSGEKLPQIYQDQTITSEYPTFTKEQDTIQNSDLPIDPTLAAIEHGVTEFNNICPGPIAQTIRDRSRPSTFDEQVSQYQSTYGAQLGTPDTFGSASSQYPLDISKWPDYSSFESLPIPLQLNSDDTHVSSYHYPMSTEAVSQNVYDPDANPASLEALPATPSCPCLANLYLTLSTLSTLSSFPVSNHTIDTILTAQKTARDVVYCPVCPRRFQTGSQNLMLGCTLLNVLADLWHKVKRASSEELKKGFSSAPMLTNDPNHFISAREGQAWRNFTNDLIRAYVFGDQSIPLPPSQTLSSPPPDQQSTQTGTTSSSKEVKIPTEHTLLFIIEALARRQRQWHSFEEPTDEFPDRCTEGYSYHHHDHDLKVTKVKGTKTDDTKSPHYCKVHGKTHKSAQPNINSNDVTDESSASTTDNTAEHAERASHADHAVCLMIVKYSMDIVRNLDTK